MRLIYPFAHAPIVRLLAPLLVALCATPAAATVYDFQDVSPGGRNLWLRGISNTGVITGSTTDGHGFVLSGDDFRLIDIPGASGTGLNKINGSGTRSVGSYRGSDNINHAFTTDLNGSIALLPDVGSPLYGTGAADINDAGLVVGSYLQSPNVDGARVYGRGYTYQNQHVDTYGAPNAYYTAILGVNDARQMVGQFIDLQDHIGGFLLNGGGFTQLAGPTGFVGISAVDINNVGQIVGSGLAGGRYHGWLLSGGAYEIIDVPGLPIWWDTYITGINDRGQMVGVYSDPRNYRPYGFVATPRGAVPEPGTLSLLAFALPMAWLKRRRF